MKELGLVNYDSAEHALAILETVDEVKDVRDKALAMELYAQQAMNTDMERRACSVRLRAEKECGKRLAEMDMATGNQYVNSAKSPDTTKQTLSDIGISKDQSSKWQRLAQVPDDEFETALSDPDNKPSTASIIRKVNGSSNRMNPDALWIWGRLRDMEKRNLFLSDTDAISGELTQAMLDDIKRMLPVAIDWLNELERSCNG